MTGDVTRVVVVRHGETVWHAENRYAGASSDIDLTDRGREQAASLATWASTRHFDAVLVSPVRRARETVAAVEAALGVEAEVVTELREIDFGIAEGRTIQELREIDEEMVHRFRSDPAAHPFPASDSPELAALAAATSLRAVAARHPGGRVLAVAHNTLLRIAMCSLLDLPVGRYREIFPRLETAQITELAIPTDPDKPASLLCLNQSPSAEPDDHVRSENKQPQHNETKEIPDAPST